VYLSGYKDKRIALNELQIKKILFFEKGGGVISISDSYSGGN